MYGQSRIFFVMARDGLLPQRLAAVHKTRGTPVLMTSLTGLVVMVMAATLKPQQIVELANVGTLTAFVAGWAVCMLVLRVRDPNRPRVFRTPLPWIIGALQHPGLSLSGVRFAAAHAGVVPGVERRRAGGLFPLRNPQKPARARGLTRVCVNAASSLAFP